MAEAAQTRAKVTGCYGTMYYVDDMARAAKFFKEALGLKPGYESPDWTEFHAGGHALCLHASGGKPGWPNGALILRVEGLHRLVADLKARGVAVSEPHEVHPGAWSADLRDPEGHAVSLYEGPKSF